ncbi:hypothetical protein L6452_23713 [Arctium lappa]|uniref:Uncharacterized protein n=1 Tax=Arctium lappa TaxID=4217 RepID=A0ACB9B371_ARCLA|nr:hypothetical protein L6452_23713 [Arctium lappa]
MGALMGVLSGYHTLVNFQLNVQHPHSLIPILDKKNTSNARMTLKCSLNKVVDTIVNKLGIDASDSSSPSWGLSVRVSPKQRDSIFEEHAQLCPFPSNGLKP